MDKVAHDARGGEVDFFEIITRRFCLFEENMGEGRHASPLLFVDRSRGIAVDATASAGGPLWCFRDVTMLVLFFFFFERVNEYHNFVERV